MATDEEDIKLGAVESFDGLGALRSRDRASGLAFALGATTSRILSRDDSKKEEIDLKFTEARKKAGATAAEAEDSGSGDTGAALVAAGEAELDQHFFRRLWSYLDKDGGGAISKDEIGILFTQLGQDSKLADELWTLLKGDAATSDQIEVDDFLKIVTTSRERMIGGKIVLWLVQYVLMFLYTFTTRMPFIFLAPEIQARGGSLTQVGAVLGSYQACRATANTVISLFGSKAGPGILYPILVACGLGGWILASQLADAGVWGMLAFMAVGFSEVVVPLQVGLLAETRADSSLGLPMFGLVMERLRAQYAAVAGGAFVAFIASGWVYNELGFEAVCYLGAAVNALQLVLGVVYLMFREKGHRVEGTSGSMLRKLVYKVTAIDVLAERIAAKPGAVILLDKAQMAAARHNALKNSEMQGAMKELFNDLAADDGVIHVKQLEQLVLSGLVVAGPAQSQVEDSDLHQQKLGAMSSSDIATKMLWFLDRNGDGQCSKQEFLAYVLPQVQHTLNPKSSDRAPIFKYAYFVVVTQAVMAMCIGTFLSTAVLQYGELGVGVGAAGMLLAVGEGLGMVALIVTNNKCSASIAKSWAEGGWDRKPLKTLVGTVFSRPFHCVPALAFAGVATAAFGSRILAVALVGQMVLSTLNDFVVSLLNEVTAGAVRNRADYLRMQSTGQWLRRCGNILTGVTGPIFFGVRTWLPWLVYGGAVFLWSMILWYMFYDHARVIAEEDGGEDPFTCFRPFLKKSWFTYEVEYANDAAELEETAEDMDIESNILWLRAELNGLRQEVAQLREKKKS